jgi:hypothetical protein
MNETSVRDTPALAATSAIVGLRRERSCSAGVTVILVLLGCDG